MEKNIELYISLKQLKIISMSLYILLDQVENYKVKETDLTEIINVVDKKIGEN